MQVIFLIILLLLVTLCSFSGVMVFINYRTLQRIMTYFGIESAVSEKKNADVEAQRRQEESDKAFTNMLVELSEEKKAKDNAPFGTYTFNELDVFDELEHTETDPEKLIKILEYGIPDEELESIVKKIESGK